MEGVRRYSDPKQPFLAGFDDLEPPPEEGGKTLCSKWRGRVVSLGGLAVSATVRSFNFHRVTNVLSSVGMGTSLQSLISTSFDRKNLPRVRQVCLTVFGQLVLFYLSQGFANVPVSAWKIFFTDAIISQLGANVEIMARWFHQHGLVRNESHLPGAKTENPTRIRTVPQPIAHALKLAAFGGGIAVSVLAKDRLIKGVASFVASFYMGQIVGETAAHLIDDQIEKHDIESSSLTEGGTKYRWWKSVFITLANLGVVLSFVPWRSNPDTAGRLRELVFAAAAAGLCMGFTDETEKRRLEKKSMQTLEEFKELAPPDPEHFPLRNRVYKIWKVAVPAIATVGMLLFTVAQVIVLKNSEARIALASNAIGFLGTYWSCKGIDRKWSKNPNDPLYSKLMANIWCATRILGIPAIMWYLSGTNILIMDNQAIQSEQSPFRIWGIIGSWLCYGIAMGREVYILASDRIGNPQLKFPVMLFSNAAIVTKLSLSAVVKA